MRELILDLRDAARAMGRAPGFAALAVLVLSTGIAAATLVFSLVHAALIRDLPFEEPDRVVWMYNLRTERDRAPLSLPDVQDYRRDASTLAGLALFTNWSANLTGSGPAERIEGTRVSGNFFGLLGLRPLVGRALQPEDAAREARVAVLTHGLWIRRFGGDPRIVGRGIQLNGASYIVVGVLPARFMFPFRDAELAVPLTLGSDPRRSDRGANFLRVVARLQPGVTVRQAKAELDAIARRLQRQYPLQDARKTGVSLYPLHREIVRDYGAILWTLFAAVGVLLAVGCGNLANLLLVRIAERQTEFAIRLSLGASRGRIVRQILCEATVLAAAGGLVGTGLASAGLAAWRAFGPASFPRMVDVGLDAPVLFFAIGVSSATAFACGMLPGWFIGVDSVELLRGRSGGVTAGPGHARIRRAFVAVQAAAATLLLVGMGLTARGFARLEHVTPGFQPDRALSVQLSLPPQAYGSRDALVRFSDALRHRLIATSGIDAVGLVSLLPLSGLLSATDLAFPDRPAPPPDEVPQAHFRVAGEGYFEAVRIRVLDGRAFTEHDDRAGQPVVIVNRTFTKRYWPGERAIGKTVQIVLSAASAPLTVVGIVDDVKQFTLDAPPTADLYIPLRQMPDAQAPLLAARMFWVIRAHIEQPRLAHEVREAVLRIDGSVATSSARTLETVVSSSLGAHRLYVRLLEGFGQIAALLCAFGVYAVAAFAAATRRRELAIRAALGASRRRLALLMLVSELWPVATGTGIGLAVAALTASRMFGEPFGAEPSDGLTYLVAGAAVLAIAAIASYTPVRRAGAVDPAAALRV